MTQTGRRTRRGQVENAPHTHRPTTTACIQLHSSASRMKPRRSSRRFQAANLAQSPRRRHSVGRARRARRKQATTLPTSTVQKQNLPWPTLPAASAPSCDSRHRLVSCTNPQARISPPATDAFPARTTTTRYRRKIPPTDLPKLLQLLHPSQSRHSLPDQSAPSPAAQFRSRRGSRGRFHDFDNIFANRSNLSMRDLSSNPSDSVMSGNSSHQYHQAFPLQRLFLSKHSVCCPSHNS